MKRIKVKFNLKQNQEVLDRMMNDFKNCPLAVKRINDLKIPQEEIEDNITLIYDFVSDLNYCKNCPGIDKCEKNNPCICTKITYNNGIVERELTPCKEYIKKITTINSFIMRDFNDDWLNNKMKDIDKIAGRDEIIHQYQLFVKNNNTQWIFINGNPNSGRSFISAVLCLDAISKNKGQVAFVNCPKRISDLIDYSYKNKEKFNKILDKLSNVPILVLDDFGNEFKNDFVRDGIIFQILSNRSNNKLFTIFTSDFTVAEIKELYSTSKSAAIRAKQIANIISSNCDNKEFNLKTVPVYK